MLTFIEPTTVLLSFYLISSVLVLLAYITPAVNTRFLTYGARDAAKPSTYKRHPGQTAESQIRTTMETGLLDKLADIKVPHKWFIHFYVTSVLSSIFWAHQIATRGRLYCFLAEFAKASNDPDSRVRVVGCCALLFIQGMRRLYECFQQPQGGASMMWVGHYLIGIAFYLATGMAVWIEGLPALEAFHALRDENSHSPPEPSKVFPPTIDLVFTAVFFGISLKQQTLHRHLGCLKKYSVPTYSSFQWIVAPHYTCECLIYVCLAVLSRPTGRYLNHTMIAALVFVVINLGISADGTRTWMRMKFGDASVAKKWKMLPGIW